MLDRPMRLRTAMLGAALLAFAGVMSQSAAAQGDGIVIVNGTRTAMIMLHIKDTRAQVWEADLLGHKPLGVQKETTIFRGGRNACVFDLKAIFEDGHRVTKQRVDLCKSPRYVLADF